MKARFFITLIVGLFFFSANAQAQKVFGYVDADSVLQTMSEYKVAEQKLQSFQNQLQEEFKRMENDLKTKIQDYQTYLQKGADVIPAIAQQKEKEIQTLKQQYDNFPVSTQQSISLKQQQLMQPLLKKVQEGIDAVAKEKGYQYVIPKGMLLYSDGKDDITADVIAKMK
ncbi:OmpH family outer membrane protein [Algivirga pacifica]|uniref:OmpH family outer membrane protein n=1 Tax=Algivirga pacifica TaxID=1162670 RepID=A0ABP9CYZ7_9BACT